MVVHATGSVTVPVGAWWGKYLWHWQWTQWNFELEESDIRMAHFKFKFQLSCSQCLASCGQLRVSTPRPSFLVERHSASA